MVLDLVVSYLGPVAPVAPLVVRNFYGWLVNSLKNGKVETYEWKLLGTTLLKLGGLAILLHWGWDLEGFDSTALVASLDAIRNDIGEPLLKAITKK